MVFEQQKPSQVLEVRGPSVVAPCGGFNCGVESIPDDLCRDAPDDPVKDLGLGNPVAEEGNAKVTSQKVENRIRADGNWGGIESINEAVVIYAAYLRFFTAGPMGNAWSAASIAVEFKSWDSPVGKSVELRY